MTLPLTTPKPSTVTVGGHTYRVNSSASAEELADLARLVDERLAALPMGQRGDPKSLVLVALGLAHDLEHEKSARTADRQAAETRIQAVVAKIDEALGHMDLDGNPLLTPAKFERSGEKPPMPIVVDAEPALATAVARARSGDPNRRANKAP